MSSKTAIVLIATLAIAPHVSLRLVASRIGGRVVLVDVPIPIYPPIAQSANISGDVHVRVDVGHDGSVASASVAKLEGLSQSSADILSSPALDAARKALFRCEGCADPTPYELVFAFRFAQNIGRARGDVHPEVVSISPSRSRILIVAEMPTVNIGPIAVAHRPRAARCLWLWRCDRRPSAESDSGEPELLLWSAVVPAYPAAARADKASADVEVNVAVQRNGKVVSAALGTTRNVVSSAQGIEVAFQSAAVAAARQATFVCRRCREGTHIYSLVYAFRFDGVLASLDLGYAAAGLAQESKSQSVVSVAADVPALEAALSVRPSALPPGCSVAPRLAATATSLFSGNPSTSDARDPIAFIRGHIVGAASPTETGSAHPSRYELQLGEGIEQAYLAQYTDAHSETTDVYGLLFGDANDASAFAELAAGSGAFRVHRQVVVAVRGANTCGAAIAELLKHEMQPERAHGS